MIVAGGRDDAYQSMSRVDILDLHNHQWYSGAPLPQPAHKMTAAVIGNTLVLMGGAGGSNEFFNKVFSIKLDDLTSEAISHKTEFASPWQTLPGTPVVSASVLAFNGAMLAMGGNRPDDSRSITCATYIHLFKPSTKTWVLVGHLPINRWRCACAVLPSGEIFLAGGALQHDIHVGVENRVHIGALQ